MDMNFYMPTKIMTGKGCVSKALPEIERFGKSCLIVTGAVSAKKSGALADVTSALKTLKIKYSVYGKIKQNPTVVSCMEAGKKASDADVDFIIGIGGGSPLDAAKAVAVIAANPGIDSDTLFSLDWEKEPLPVIAVGTTAGTGSEVTPVSVLTNDSGLKKSIRTPLIYPALALGDAAYTMSLSEQFTKSTAVDAMAHCVESYFNRNANEISKSFALSGIRILIDVFRKIDLAGTNSLNIDDREALYNASLFGGLAISVTGTAFPHALGYFLTELHDIPHGTACAVYLPAFIRHNAVYATKTAAEFFAAIGMSEEDFRSLIEKITPECDVIVSDEEREELAPRWVNNGSLKKSWGEITPELVDKLLIALFSE